MLQKGKSKNDYKRAIAKPIATDFFNQLEPHRKTKDHSFFHPRLENESQLTGVITAMTLTCSECGEVLKRQDGPFREEIAGLVHSLFNEMVDQANEELKKAQQRQDANTTQPVRHS